MKVVPVPKAALLQAPMTPMTGRSLKSHQAGPQVPLQASMVVSFLTRMQKGTSLARRKLSHASPINSRSARKALIFEAGTI